MRIGYYETPKKSGETTTTDIFAKLYKSPTIKYFNVVYNNYQVGVSTNKIPATVYKRYGQPIIDNCSEWYMSVERFNIPVESIPLFVYFPSNAYAIHVQFGVFGISQIPDMISTIDTTNTSAEGYYDIHYYDQFVRMLNTTLNNLVSQITLPPGVTLPSIPHFSVTSSGVLQYTAPQYFFNDDKSPTDPNDPIPGQIIKVYIGNALNYLMEGLPINNDPGGAPVPPSIYRLVCYDTGNNMVAKPTYNEYVMSSNSNYNTLVKWNDCKGIILTTDMMPLEPEIYPQGISTATSSPITGNVTFQDASILNRKSIIGKYDIQYNSPTQIRPTIIQYISFTKYRYIELLGSEPLTVFDLKIYWFDSINQLHQLFINPYDTITMRLIFVKKGTQV